MATLEDKVNRLRLNCERSIALRKIFAGKNGRMAMSLLEDLGFWHKSTYVSQDPQGTALNEGNRQILLKIKEIASMSIADIEDKTEEKIRTIKKPKV